MKDMDQYIECFVDEIKGLWPDEAIAALHEKVTCKTILRYLLRDQVRVKTIVEHISNIASGKKILDIGCAYGFYDIILKNHFGCDISGMEIEESADAYCRLLYKHDIPVIRKRISKEKLPIDAESFDIVIFSEVIEHLRISPLRALRDIHRILKPGGMMLLTTPNICYLRNILNLLGGKNILQEFPDDDELLDNISDEISHVRVYTMGEMKRLLEKAGFNIVESIYLSTEVLNLTMRPLLPAHMIYKLLITVVPSFRDVLVLVGKKFK